MFGGRVPQRATTTPTDSMIAGRRGTEAHELLASLSITTGRRGQLLCIQRSVQTCLRCPLEVHGQR